MNSLEDDEGFIATQINSAFGHTRLYEIFGVEQTATTNEIKKAYMKLALKHHPDKGGDSSTFQAISMAHSILSDEERRKVYDESGLLQAEEDTDGNEQTFEFWNQYFRNLFPKLTVEAIEKFAKEYIGSKEEERDILSAYEKYQGNCVKMMDVIMLAEIGEEQRIVNTIDRLIHEGKISSTKAYEKSRKTLLQRYENYLNNLAEEHVQGEDLEIEEEQDSDEGGEEEEAERTSNPKKKKRSEKNSSQKEQKQKKKAKKTEESSSLEELILHKNQQKAKSRQDVFSKIFSKYGDGEELNESLLEDPLSDEEFQKFQKSLFEKKDSKETKKHRQSSSKDKKK